MGGSMDFFQDPKTMRAQDHRCFVDHLISRVKRGSLVVERKIPGKERIYPRDVDLTKEKI
jgi:hypothetical protein